MQWVRVRIRVKVTVRVSVSCAFSAFVGIAAVGIAACTPPHARTQYIGKKSFMDHATCPGKKCDTNADARYVCGS